MSSRPRTELEFVASREPLATVEVDIDSIPPDFYGYADIIARGLAAFAAGSQKPRATVYVLQTDSVSFHEPTYSAFFAVAGSGRALEQIHSAFAAVEGVRVRYSDSIRPRDGLVQFHIQDGLVWQPEDAITWYSSGDFVDASLAAQPEAAATHTDEVKDDTQAEAVEGEVGNDTHGTAASPAGVPSGVRFRRARSDASIGAIRRSIENIFGLPAGSVKLCGPEGRPLRSDAAVRTLRKRWATEGT
jgi:hypothetical protein